MMGDAHIDGRLFILLVCILMILIYPRFNREDRFGIDAYTTQGKPATEMLADAGKYINHVRYFRGEANAEVLREPWAYRPLPIYLASLLPFNPMTSINVVNVLFLIVGLYFLLKTISLMGLTQTSMCFAGFMFTVSFPVFFYTSVAYIDPVLIGFLCVGLYLIVAKRQLLFFLMLFLGAMVKDPYIIILPAWTIYQICLTPNKFVKAIVSSLLALLLFISLLYLIRLLTPVDESFFWVASLNGLEFNLSRPRAWIAWMLTFGPAGILATYFLFKENIRILKSPEIACCSVGMLGSFAVFGYSFFSVHLDGRYIWIAYPFMIPLACLLLENRTRTS